MKYFDVASLRMKYTADEVKEDYSKKKYIAKSELASNDWKTQAARRFKNIPKGAEVKMIKKDFWNYYGKFSEVEWNGNIYYVDPNDIEEIEVLEKTNEELKTKPKKYLTWEDVIKNHAYKVLLNGKEYKITKWFDDYEYRMDYISITGLSQTFIYEVDKQFFNDLHLELVEE